METREFKLRRAIATHMLQGMLASAPLTDRTEVDKDLWSQQALQWADALIRNTLQRVPATNPAALFLQYWGSLELTHDRKTDTYTAKHGKWEVSNAPTIATAVSTLHEMMSNKAVAVVHREVNKRDPKGRSRRK